MIVVPAPPTISDEELAAIEAAKIALAQAEAEALESLQRHQHQERIAKLVPEFNAARFVNDLVRTATWGTYPHDQEEQVEGGQKAFVPEDEPSPPPIDAWARSAGKKKMRRI